jgi:CxxC motif-containing protein (DUF1111 family)
VLAHGGSPSHEQRARRTLVNGQYIGRFGKKARAIDLTHQTVVAYSQDMGITSDLIPQELHSGRSGGIVADAVPDPEAPGSVVDAVVFYLRTLRAPPRRSATSADVASGDSLFVRIGCSSCHTPTLRTGRSSIAPLDRVVFQPFTDLLLHDMGPRARRRIHRRQCHDVRVAHRTTLGRRHRRASARRNAILSARWARPLAA